MFGYRSDAEAFWIKGEWVDDMGFGILESEWNKR
jgi:RimJ/RimL family protein N-acetyltransferase